MTASVTVKEYPLLLQGPLVLATMRGRKTMTRRVVLPQPHLEPLRGGKYGPSDPFVGEDGIWRFMRGVVSYQEDDVGRCPYGKPGDRLWVRENWSADYPAVRYAADGNTRLIEPDTPEGEDLLRYYDRQRGKWRPSIHIPRWASRIDLKVTSVRLERVQDITAADALAEGIAPACDLPPRDCFSDLWESLNASRGYGWNVNPWVWVIGYSLLQVRS